MDDLTGKQLGAYRIVAPLGEGGMAAVYKAYHAAMERHVALKILPRNFANDPQFVIRFKQEARVLAQLQHPHILPVFDFGEADGYTYLVMPFIKSGTLTDLLKGRPFDLRQLNRFVEQLGGALDYAHERGLIHRDVKPSNVLIDESGNCLLSDFGLAKIIEANAQLTSTGAVLGTPIYMSPEQGMGRVVDRRTDVYALGVMLYEMATGRVPYDAETPMAVMLKHISDSLPPPRALNPSLPESVEAVILKALAKDPASRFQTTAALTKALDGAVRGHAPEESARESAENDLSLPTLVASSGDFGPTVAPAPRKTAPQIEHPPRRAFAPVKIILGLTATVGACGLLFIAAAIAVPALSPLRASPTQLAAVSLTEPGAPGATATRAAETATNTPVPIAVTTRATATTAPTATATTAPTTVVQPTESFPQPARFETSDNCNHASAATDAGSTAITFTNTSHRDVSVYWLDGEGKEHFHFDVLIGRWENQVTGPGHWWCVREKYTGNVVAAASAGPAPENFNIPAPAVNCGRASEPNTAAATIVFANKSQRTVAVYWVDFDGVEQHYTDLRAGQASTQETGVNHVWCVRDQRGTAIITATGAANTQTVGIP